MCKEKQRLYYFFLFLLLLLLLLLCYIISVEYSVIACMCWYNAPWHQRKIRIYCRLPARKPLLLLTIHGCSSLLAGIWRHVQIFSCYGCLLLKEVGIGISLVFKMRSCLKNWITFCRTLGVFISTIYMVQLYIVHCFCISCNGLMWNML